jgi:predicted amidohydrolase YtcJ
MARATAHGLETAIHAIGDAACHDVLAAYAETGARGSMEHAQLMTRADVAEMARLGVRASVQPAHLLDDRDVTELVWPDRADRCFPLRWMVDDGVTLALGSDAPVSPLDPWLAIAAAVHRSADERPAWHPEQALTPREALAASVDGQGSVHAGGPADLVLLDADPLDDSGSTADQAARLRSMPVAATWVAGRLVHGDESAFAR